MRTPHGIQEGKEIELRNSPYPNIMDIIEATIAHPAACMFNVWWFCPPPPSIDTMLINCSRCLVDPNQKLKTLAYN